MAGVALGDIYLRFAWQEWGLCNCVGSGGALGRRVAPRHFYVVGVALGDIYRRFAWQAWDLWDWAGSGGALGPRPAEGFLKMQAFLQSQVVQALTMPAYVKRQLRHLLKAAALMVDYVDSMREDFEVAQLDCGFGYCIYH